MHIQLIYAHPVEGSFCSALRDVARRTLQRSGHDVHVTDLYAEGFPPALSREERLSYEAAGANIVGVRPYTERVDGRRRWFWYSRPGGTACLRS